MRIDDFITDEGRDGATPRRCQDCHMPDTFAGIYLQKKIASRLALPVRWLYPRCSLGTTAEVLLIWR